MSAAMVATVKDNKIFITMMVEGEAKEAFELVPYKKTPDGDQQLFGIDLELERIALCISDFNGVPTEVIKPGFVARAMSALTRSSKMVQDMTQIVEKMNEEAKSKKASETKTASEEALPVSTVPTEGAGLGGNGHDSLSKDAGPRGAVPPDKAVH